MGSVRGSIPHWPHPGCWMIFLAFLIALAVILFGFHYAW